ncbi:MAG: S-layer homology domain-containing protein, partial [Acidimicrobiia bacterium]|nr:S-layer homology domain-containing protein [Acidimicrobiia bacterium]
MSVEGLMVMVGRLVRSALSVGLLAGVLVVLPVVGPVPEAGAAPAVVGGSCSSPGPHGFGDVPAGSYYEVAVGWLADQGITSGTSAGVYSPLAKVTRGQMA